MALPDQAHDVAAAAADDRAPVAICCGGGTMPFAVADALIRRGRQPVLFAIEKVADPARVSAYPHHWVPLGKFGRLRRLLQSAGCRDVVFIGALVRPRLSQIRLDWTTLKLMPRIAAGFRGGDDHLLRAIGRVFEEHGFRLLGADEVAPEILVPQGVLGGVVPDASARADIAHGMSVLDAIGRFDIGQAVVVAGARVIAVEAAEGTDAMLTRVAELRAQGRVNLASGIGVLVKAPKPGQDRRYDLPSIGPATVEAVKRAGLGGIAVAAGAAVIAEPERMIALANTAGVFLVGVGADGTLA